MQVDISEKLASEIGRDFKSRRDRHRINMGFSHWDMLFAYSAKTVDFFITLYVNCAKISMQHQTKAPFRGFCLS